MDNDPDREDGGGLMFAWHRKKSVLTYLAVFGAASLIIHLCGFYLFQVVYPASGRLEPEPARVTLLNESQPSVSALLKKIEDRLVYLRPASSGSDVRVSLGNHSVQFQSSFSDRQVNFKTTDPVAAIRGGQSDQATGDPLATARRRSPEWRLPPFVITSPEKVEPPASESVEERWRISGDLENRALRDADAFAESLPALGTPPAVRFRIGVGSNGAVLSHLPVAGQSHPRIGEISEAIRTALRFEPTTGTETEWGWLDISR